MSKNTEAMKEADKYRTPQLGVTLPPYFEDLLFKTMEKMQVTSKGQTLKHGLIELAKMHGAIDQKEYEMAIKYQL